MDIVELTGFTKDILTVIALVLGSFAAIFVYSQLAPVLELRIIPRWADASQKYLIIRFEVENKSRVRVNRPRGRFQVVKHSIDPGTTISRWVPFEQGAYRENEAPLDWSAPIKIFTSTRQIYPGEKITFEHIYHCTDEKLVYHIGLQVKIRFSLLQKIVNRKSESWQQTTTCFIVRE